jgi:heterodisulfide reductase subunit A
MSVANRLASEEVEVLLLDRSSHPGGQAVFYGCKATDACVRCGVCLVRDAMSDLRRSRHVDGRYSTTVRELRRLQDGSFRIDVQTRPNAIDAELCVECGACAPACPEGAISLVPGWKYVVEDNCTACGKCVDACPVHAIDLNRRAAEDSFEVSGVVVATGFEPFDPRINRKWGYGANPRVVTGSEMEKLFQSESYVPEPLKADISRMAFVQCVGSRNIMEGERHCSRVCCAYALRMAARLKDQMPDLDIDFYYMDIQPFGKGFDEFWSKVSGKLNFIRSNPIAIRNHADGRPVVRYESMEDLACREQTYDLVVLSNGITPSLGSEEVAEKIGLRAATSGFFAGGARGFPGANGSGGESTGASGGVFVAGTCRQPMRIDECVEDASTVAQGVLRYLGAGVKA